MVFNIGQPSSRGNSKSKGLSDYKDGSNLKEYNNTLTIVIGKKIRAIDPPISAVYGSKTQ